jgi:hypothetical protein
VLERERARTGFIDVQSSLPEEQSATFFLDFQERDDFLDDEGDDAFSDAYENASEDSRGVSPRTMRAIPSVCYRKACRDESCFGRESQRSRKLKKRHGFGDECAVCLSEFADGETLACLPACSHLFHRACVERWLKNKQECPKCRATVRSVGGPVSSTDETSRGDEDDWKWRDIAEVGEGVIFVPSPGRVEALFD